MYKRQEEKWVSYYNRLLDVQRVRNDSAHPEVVSAHESDIVIKALFEDELLAKTVEYVERKETVTI